MEAITPKPMNPKVGAGALGGGLAVALANFFLDSIDMIYFAVTGEPQITNVMGAPAELKSLFTETYRTNLSIIVAGLGSLWAGYRARDGL